MLELILRQRTSAGRAPTFVRDCQASLTNRNGGKRYPTSLEIAGQSVIATGPLFRLLHLQQFRIHALIGPWARLLDRRFCYFFPPSFALTGLTPRRV